MSIFFGSQVYGTATPESDTDYIVVSKTYFDSKNTDIHVYTQEQFQLLLDRHDIQALECVHAPREFKLKQTVDFKYILDKQKLRTSISTIASHSWVKGKKKLTVMGDFSLELSLKSIFHSLRILDFGIQLSLSNKIENFSSMNYILKDIYKLSESFQYQELWNKIEEKYKPFFNKKSSEFKALAPKDTSEKDRRIQLEKFLDKHLSNYSSDIVEGILEIFQK